jgi:DNA-binding transcriptional MerR regulator
VAEEFGVDDLARRGGTTVRQVRLYIERGLLPRPRRQGRSAFYSDLHVRRLEMILRLIGRGYTMAAIKELADAWERNEDLGDVLGLEAAVTEPFGERPRRVTREDIASSFPSGDLDAVIERATEIGLMQPDGDEFVVAVPAFFDVGAELVDTGVPVQAVLDIAERIQTATADLADDFVAMFLQHVWQPFADAGQPADQIDRVISAIERQRAVTARVVVAALDAAMQERVDAAAITQAHAANAAPAR